VDTDEVAVVSSGSVKVGTSRGPAVPVVLRVELSGTVQSGHLRVRHRRRLFRRR
jgi:hypothetical protein